MRLKLSYLILVLAQTALCVESRAQTPAPSCPSVVVESKVLNPRWAINWGVACPGAPIIFTAAVTGVDPKENYTLNWTVSAGKIVKGQGTSSITVSTEDAVGARVTATVELVGLSSLKSDCNKTAQESVQVDVCCLPPCPTLSVQCPVDVPQLGEPVTVSVNVSGGEPELSLKYKWQVSAGEIVSGQGTPTIKISTLNTAGESITATVEVDGIPPECDRTESCTLPVAEYSSPERLRDENGDTGGADGKARLDGLAFQPGRGPGGGIRHRLWSPSLGFCALSGN